MELLNTPDRPPDLPALTLQDLHEYELGTRTFTADELASAHYLRQTIIENTVVLVPTV